MLLTENFVQVIIHGYQISPNIAGQQLIYNLQNQTFGAIFERGHIYGLKRRCILFSLLTIATIIRIIDLKRQMKAQNLEGRPSVETNISIMMMFMFVVTAERYRTRSKFPNDFVDFLNGAMVIEKTYGNGKHIKTVNLKLRIYDP